MKESVTFMRKQLKEMYDDDVLMDDEFIDDEFMGEDEFIDDDPFFESDHEDDDMDDEDEDMDEADDMDDEEKDELDEMWDDDDMDESDEFLDDEFDETMYEEEDEDEFYDDEDDLDEDDSEDLDMYESKLRRKRKAVRESSKTKKTTTRSTRSKNTVTRELREQKLALGKLAILHTLTIKENLRGSMYNRALNMLDRAQTLDEAKTISRKISENLKLRRKAKSSPIKESTNFVKSRNVRSTDPAFERMARLAGLTPEE
jgi:hypothetical protein